MPLIPVIRPFIASNKTAERPIKTPPKADAKVVNSVMKINLYTCAD